MLFGYHFFSFRLISFISGVLSLFTFFLLLKNIFKNKIAILTALLLFSINSWLIFYSNELKHYSLDVLVCILLLLSYKYINLKQISSSFTKVFLYTLISALLILTSFSAIFIIPSIIFAKIIEERYFNYKCLFILLGICCSCLYLYLIDQECYQFMRNSWDYNLHCFLSPTFQSFKHKILICSAFLGVIFLFIDKTKERFLILFTIIFSLLASLFKIYPLGERISLYLIPIIIILITEVIEFPCHNFKKIPNTKTFLILKSLLTALIILYSLNFQHIFTINRYELFENLGISWEIRYNDFNFAKEFLNKYNEKDTILSSNTISMSLNFYNKYFKINKKLIIFEFPVNDETEQINQLKILLDAKINNPNKLWILGVFNNYDMSPNMFNIVENELNKRNFKYTKIIDNNFYMYEI